MKKTLRASKIANRRRLYGLQTMWPGLSYMGFFQQPSASVLNFFHHRGVEVPEQVPFIDMQIIVTPLTEHDRLRQEGKIFGDIFPG